MKHWNTLNIKKNVIFSYIVQLKIVFFIKRFIQ